MTNLTAQQRVLLADVRDSALSVDEILDLVRDPSCGGLCAFIGMVRDHDHERDVDGLDYSAHPSAVEGLQQVCLNAAEGHPTARVAVVHRVGQLAIGDLAVVVAAAAPHRDEAFSACREVIETLKAQVPIWKHQMFTDGADEWVGIA